MSCPLLGRHRPECRAVSGDPISIPREVIAAYCRANHASCPAFRYLRAAGIGAKPADFRAWVLLRVRPGRCDPDADALPTTDGA